MRILYAAQVGVAPPTFALFTNVATELHFSYERFLKNRLREKFGFLGHADSPAGAETEARMRFAPRLTRPVILPATCSKQDCLWPTSRFPTARCSRHRKCAKSPSVQPYVLRSWESEFPDLGVSKSAGGPRIYRRADVERVLRIKQLVFTDGLTLAGVRRRIDEEAPPVLEEAEAAPIKELLGRNAKERLAEVKRGLMGILEMLNARPGDARASTRHRQRARAGSPAKRKNGSRPAQDRPPRTAKKRRQADASQSTSDDDQSTVFLTRGTRRHPARHPRRADPRHGGAARRADAHRALRGRQRSGFRSRCSPSGLVVLVVDLALARGWTQLLVQLTMVLFVAAGAAREYTFIFTAAGNFSSRWIPQMRGTDSGVARAAGEVAADAGARLDGAVGHSRPRLRVFKENDMKLGAIGAMRAIGA